MSKLLENTVIVEKDCPAVLVPAGTPVLLPKGTEVRITQALGDTITVSIYGNLARIAAEDVPALGEDVHSHIQEQIAMPENATIEEQIDCLLKTCYDPEIPVDIMALGLIYKIDIQPEDDNHNINIQMTLTAPGCGIGPTLMAEIEQKLKTLPTVKDVNVDLVFDPPWHRDMMSDDAKLKLNLF